MQRECRRLELDGKTPRAMARVVLEQSVHRTIVILRLRPGSFPLRSPPSRRSGRRIWAFDRDLAFDLNRPCYFVAEREGSHCRVNDLMRTL